MRNLYSFSFAAIFAFSIVEHINSTRRANMEQKIVSMEDFKREQRRRDELEQQKKSKVEEATDWFNNNREFAMIIIPAGIGLATLLLKGGISLVKTCYRTKQATKIQQQKARTMYDYSLHRYWTLKRDLTNTEMLEIARRRKDGEKLAEILRDLRVI